MTSTITTDELLPCPFCGLAMERQAQFFSHPDVNDGACPLKDHGFYNEQAAAWNTRAAMPQSSRVEELEATVVALANGADKCAEAPHFIVQPFLAIYKKHGETIASARKALSQSNETQPLISEGSESVIKGSRVEELEAENRRLREELGLWLILVNEGGVPRYTITPGAALNTVVTSTASLLASYRALSQSKEAQDG